MGKNIKGERTMKKKWAVMLFFSIGIIGAQEIPTVKPEDHVVLLSIQHKIDDAQKRQVQATSDAQRLNLQMRELQLAFDTAKADEAKANSEMQKESDKVYEQAKVKKDVYSLDVVEGKFTKIEKKEEKK
jgi:hypothetical protein